MSMTNILSLAISEEKLGEQAPVLFQAGIIAGMQEARQMGFTGVEIHIRNPARLDAEALKQASENLGVKITAVGTGLEYALNKLSFTSADSAVRKAIQDRFMEHIDLAAKLDSVVFVGLCRGTAPDMASRTSYLDTFAAQLLPVQAYADRCNVILTIEPITYYMTNLLNTVEETLEFMARPGFEKMELLLDSHHMFLEDKDMYARALEICKGKIGHFHISDSNRRYPGGGNIDFDRIAFKLKEIGYTGPVSLEVLPYPSGTEAARHGIEWMKKHWQ